MKYLANAFSLQMVPDGGQISIRPANWSEEFISSDQFQIKVLYGRKSIIGHKDLAMILGVEQNRESIVLQPGDSLLVAQVAGGRLPEGSTTLPEGFKLQFYYVEIEAEMEKWDSEVSLNSVYGAILGFGKIIAEKFRDGTARPMKDVHNNFIVEITGHGFYGRLWDE